MTYQWRTTGRPNVWSIHHNGKEIGLVSMLDNSTRMAEPLTALCEALTEHNPTHDQIGLDL